MTWLSLIADLVSLLRIVADYTAQAQQRDIGRRQAISEALTIASEELRLATQARFDADAAHARDPSDDAFDRTFQRD